MVWNLLLSLLISQVFALHMHLKHSVVSPFSSFQKAKANNYDFRQFSTFPPAFPFFPQSQRNAISKHKHVKCQYFPFYRVQNCLGFFVCSRFFWTLLDTDLYFGSGTGLWWNAPFTYPHSPAPHPFYFLLLVFSSSSKFTLVMLPFSLLVVHFSRFPHLV